MKIKHIISSISPLACILGWNCMTLNPVNAATFQFTYIFDSTETLSGSFEGDIAGDGNTVENLSNLEATYSRIPDIEFDTLDTDSFFTRDSSEFLLVGRPSPGSGTFFSLVRGVDGPEFAMVTLDDVEIAALDNPLGNNMRVTMVDEPKAIPEPGITLALAFAGSFACWQKLNKKQIPSSSRSKTRTP